MKTKIAAVSIAIVIAAVSTGCGPSKEVLSTRTAVQATTVAAGWTLTPTVTTTATSTITPTPTDTSTPTISPTPDPRYYDKKGGFSFIPPENWVGVDADSYKIDKKWFFPQEEDFDCEIYFMLDNDFFEPPWSWAEQMIAVYEKNAPGYKFIYKKPFPTEYFPNGYSFAYFVYLQGTYRDTNYMFAEDGKFLTAAFLCKANKVNVGPQDASMRTLMFT